MHRSFTKKSIYTYAIWLFLTQCTVTQDTSQTHDPQFLQQIKRLYKNKEYDSIIDRISTKSSPHYTSQLYLTKAYLKKKEYHKAFRALKRQAQAFEDPESSIPKKSRALYHSLLGYTYEKLNDPQAAEREHFRAHRYLPQSPTAWINLANIYIQRGKEKSAKSAYQNALTQDKDAAAAHRGLGKLAFQQNKYKEAAQHYEKALQISPRSSELYFTYAKTLQALKKESSAHEMRAKGYYLQKDFRSSLTELKKIKRYRHNPELLKMAISLLIHLQETRQARQFIEFGLKRFPQDDEFAYNKAQIFFQKGNYTKALTEIQQALKSFPRSHSLTVLKAHTYRHLHKEKQAFLAYSAALKLDETDVHAREYVAQHHRIHGEKDLEFFHQAIVYYYTKDYSQAATVFTWISKDFAKRSEVIYYQGLTAWRQGKQAEAHAHFQNCLKTAQYFKPCKEAIEALKKSIK